MADDPDEAERPATDEADQPAHSPADQPAATHARIDRQHVPWSVETTPESLYLQRIAVLEARVDTLQTRVAQRDNDLQHVIDRYETLLDEPSGSPGELRADGGEPTRPTRQPDGLLARLRALLE